MSIISDALKKAEKEKGKKSGETPVFGVPLKKSSIPKKKKFPKIFLFIFLIVIFGLGTLKLKNINKIVKQVLPQTNIKEIPKIITPAEVTEPKEEPKKEKVRFVLSGILFDEKESFAIINGELVKKGDFIEEAEVVEINPKQVKLLYGEETIILKLP